MGPAVETLATRLQIALEFHQPAPVDLALEIDHRFERHPVVVPPPRVELRLVGGAQADVVVPPDQPQQIPDLLLAAVAAAPFALDPVMGNFVTQPLARAAEYPDVLRLE